MQSIGIYFAIDIVANGSLQADALNGSSLTINFVENVGVTITDENAETSNAQVLFTDGFTDIGVIHAIDQVLLPTP